MSDATPPATHPVRALRNVQADGVYLAEGEEGGINPALVAALVAVGAVEDLDPKPPARKAKAAS